MNNFLRNIRIVIFTLVVLVTIAAYALLLRQDIIQHYLSEEINVKTIDFTAKLITFLFILVGGIFSYYKFFKGHLFLSHLSIHTTSDVIEIDHNKNLHVLNIQLANSGNFSVFNPLVKVKFENYPFNADYKIKTLIDKNGVRKDDGSTRDFSLRPGVKNTFVFTNEIDKKEVAFFYRVEVSQKDRTWYNEIVVDNHLRK
ncbi:MAG TPA: hypothetical protein VKN36_17415 [Eudoraea sp.]|nr:hypothetical protein [Eudoraea sp.]